MNWDTEEGRRLLWRAWPRGYLKMRGVVTVGGWTCVATGDALGEGVSYWARVPPTAPDQALLVLLDDLPDPRVNAEAMLPLPDPADTASWACILADLVAASVAARGSSRLNRWAVEPARMTGDLALDVVNALVFERARRGRVALPAPEAS